MVILTIYINHFIKFKHVFIKVRCTKKITLGTKTIFKWNWYKENLPWSRNQAALILTKTLPGTWLCPSAMMFRLINTVWSWLLGHILYSDQGATTANMTMKGLLKSQSQHCTNIVPLPWCAAAKQECSTMVFSLAEWDYSVFICNGRKQMFGAVIEHNPVTRCCLRALTLTSPG